MRHPYFETVQLIERLHRHFLEVIKADLDRMNIQDINNVQALILYNIGSDELTVGELTARGYYLGSNVSYNVKKMVENGYLTQERSIHDKRSVRIKLSDKGRKLNEGITRLYKRHEDRLAGAGLSDARLETMNQVLRDLEVFWGEQMGVGGLSVAAG